VRERDPEHRIKHAQPKCIIKFHRILRWVFHQFSIDLQWSYIAPGWLVVSDWWWLIWLPQPECLETVWAILFNNPLITFQIASDPVIVRVFIFHVFVTRQKFGLELTWWISVDAFAAEQQIVCTLLALRSYWSWNLSRLHFQITVPLHFCLPDEDRVYAWWWHARQ
jgi:hypothetical protein